MILNSRLAYCIYDDFEFSNEFKHNNMEQDSGVMT